MECLNYTASSTQWQTVSCSRIWSKDRRTGACLQHTFMTSCSLCSAVLHKTTPSSAHSTSVSSLCRCLTSLLSMGTPRILTVLAFPEWCRPTTRPCSLCSCGDPPTLPLSLTTWQDLQSKLQWTHKIRFIIYTYNSGLIKCVCTTACIGLCPLSSLCVPRIHVYQ